MNRTKSVVPVASQCKSTPNHIIKSKHYQFPGWQDDGVFRYLLEAYPLTAESPPIEIKLPFH